MLLSRQTKLKFIAVLFLVFSLTLSGCFFKKSYPVDDKPFETGTVIDVTDKSGQELNTKVGDVIYLKLEGEAKSGYQWQVVSPTSDSTLVLKDHKVIGINDPNIMDGKFTDEWTLRVEETGEVILQFDYIIPGKPQEPKDSFTVKILSQ